MASACVFQDVTARNAGLMGVGVLAEHVKQDTHVMLESAKKKVVAADAHLIARENSAEMTVVVVVAEVVDQDKNVWIPLAFASLVKKMDVIQPVHLVAMDVNVKNAYAPKDLSAVLKDGGQGVLVCAFNVAAAPILFPSKPRPEKRFLKLKKQLLF